MSRLFDRVDGASLVAFRIIFGLVAAGHAYWLVSAGHVGALWVEPALRLAWPGFGWLPVWPGNGIYLHFFVLALLGVAVAAGAAYRLSATLLCLGWTYVLALCEVGFRSGFHLLLAFAVLLALVPAHRTVSVDAFLRPRHWDDTAPAWALTALRAQLAIALLGFGLAWFDIDWMRGHPLRLWLPERQGLPLLGWVHGSATFALAASWALLAAHLLLVPALACQRIRPFVCAVLIVQWLWIQQCFDLGVLPLLVIAGTSLFLAPDWPRRLFRWPRRTPREPTGPPRRGAALLTATVAVWLAADATPTLLALFASERRSWSAAGEPLAWRVLTESRGVDAQLVLGGPEGGAPEHVDLRAELTPRRARRVTSSPRLLQRYARLVASRAGAAPPPLRARTLATLNGREPQRWLDPQADLVRAPTPGPFGAAWIRPLEVPLARRWPTSAAFPAPREEWPTK